VRDDAGSPIERREVVSTSTSCPARTRPRVSSRATGIGPPKSVAGQYAGVAKRIRRGPARRRIGETLALTP
jgi:hypothetical protein